MEARIPVFIDTLTLDDDYFYDKFNQESIEQIIDEEDYQTYLDEYYAQILPMDDDDEPLLYIDEPEIVSSYEVALKSCMNRDRQ